jgi:hypothetical protein
MADLQLGESFSKMYRLQSDGSAHTISDVGFRPDKVVVWNQSGWSDAGEFVKSVWVRDMSNGDALQFRNIVDNAATGNDNTVFEGTNGLSVVTNAAGVDSSSSAVGAITGATAANPVVITDAAHGLSDGDVVRITDVAGMVELNNRRFRVNNSAANTFELQDPETRENVDGSNFTAYTSGGQWNKLNRVDANRDVLDAETYDVTLGSAVVGDDDDVLHVELFKYGAWEDLGDIA